MSIEIHSFGTPCDVVNVEEFERDLRTALTKDRSFGNCHSIRVYFIHKPQLKTSVNADIDLLLIMLVENVHGNYLMVRNPSGQVSYIHNLIMPIKFDTSLSSMHINLRDVMTDPRYTEEIVFADDGYNEENSIEFDVHEYVTAMKFNTQLYIQQYLTQYGLNIEKHQVHILPIYWLLGRPAEFDFSYETFLYAPKFGWEELWAHIRFGLVETKKNSVFLWKDGGNNDAFEDANRQILGLVACIEQEQKIGKLTENKIYQVQKAFDEDEKIYQQFENTSSVIDEDSFSLMDTGVKVTKAKKLSERILAGLALGKSLILITGKAGSGKSFELRLLIKKLHAKDKKRSDELGTKENSSIYYFTYNKSLVSDMHKLLKSSANITTIHKFIYRTFFHNQRRSVALLLNAERFNELEQQLEQDSQCLRNLLSKVANQHFDNVDELSRKLSLLANRGDAFQEFLKIFFNDLKRNSLHLKGGYTEVDNAIVYLETFKDKRLNLLISKLMGNVFLEDYDRICQAALLMLENPKKFLQKYNLEFSEAFDRRLQEILRSSVRHKVRSRYKEDVRKKYQERIKKETEQELQVLVENMSWDDKIARFENSNKWFLNYFKKKYAFVDEGQDFTTFERDIIFTLFGNNVIVASGGKEQLVRSTKECDWTIDSTGKSIPYIHIKKHNRSYRLKSKIAELCNFIGEKFKINMDLIASSSKDEGQIIVRVGTYNPEVFERDFEYLEEKGKERGLSNYESILVLTEASSVDLYEESGYVEKEQFQITEHNNVIVQSVRERDKEPRHLKKEGRDFYLYRAGKEETIPISQQFRHMFFESCRGLEAWSTMSLYLDEFFERKRQEDDAKDFLNGGGTEDLLITDDERRDQYAAVWVLMVLTRTMDTCYIHLKNPHSRLGKVIAEFMGDDFSKAVSNEKTDSFGNMDDDVPF